MISKFDNRYDPAIRLDCDSLLDSSGNGLHLSGSGAIFRAVYGKAIGMSPLGVLNRGGVSDAVLRDYDSLTIMALVILRSVPSATWLCSFSASGETEATNYLWSLQMVNQNSLAYFTEHGAGVDISPAFSAAPAGKGLPALGVPFHLALRLKAVTGGLIGQFFVQGEPFGDPSPVLTAPSGGTTAQLIINQGGTTVFDLLGFEVDNTDLSDSQIKDSFNQTLGDEHGYLTTEVKSLWTGALTDDGATVVVQLTHASDDVRLAVTGPGGIELSDPVSVAHGAAAILSIDGLLDDMAYTYEIECDGEAVPGPTGAFTTLSSLNPASFTVAFAGDANTGSNAVVFDTIREMEPLMFFHLGDLHYTNINTNSVALFNAAYDVVLAQSRQAQLYREIPTVFLWDDHDYGPNNSDSTAPGKAASCATYRARVPHYALVDSMAIYQTWDIGRVRFILTDERSQATPNSATDNSSKSMLGSAQKTWFKNLLSNSSGKLIVWLCSRTFGGVPTVGADHWGGFTTERTELANYIHANCPGRVVVLSADMHALGIDDGSHHDYATGGGEPLRTFQAAPLDIAITGGYGGATYTSGLFTGSNQFGTMQVDDAGGASVDVTWRAFNAGATQLTSLAFTVAL